jgi:hypothetical protein
MATIVYSTLQYLIRSCPRFSSDKIQNKVKGGTINSRLLVTGPVPPLLRAVVGKISKHRWVVDQRPVAMEIICTQVSAQSSAQGALFEDLRGPQQ